MSQKLQTTGSRPSIEKILIIGAAIFAVAAAAPSAAYARSSHISIEGLNFGDDEDLLEQLIEMDPDDIEDLRDEMADARDEIADAILEIEDAREEAREAPGGAVLMKIALGTASTVVTKATGKVFKEVKADLDEAADELETVKDQIGAAEYRETKMAIAVVREELAKLEASLAELTDAMRA